jgi:hypothetical protein
MAGNNEVHDRAGMRIGRLTVVKFSGFKEYKSGPRRSLWLCKCDCGNENVISARNIAEKNVLSCGCLQKEMAKKNAKHNMSRTKIYKIWTTLKQRCENNNDKNYPRYGGRGIMVCKEWADSFDAFYMHMGDMPTGCSLDRIDNNGNYEPGNVRWATKVQQTRNKRGVHLFEFNGEMKTLKEITHEFGASYQTVHQRIFKLGMSLKDALLTPNLRRKNHSSIAARSATGIL